MNTLSCLCRQTSAATFLGGKRRWGVHKKLESVSRQHPDHLIALGVVTTHTSFKTELCLAENPMGAFDCIAEIQTLFSFVQNRETQKNETAQHVFSLPRRIELF